MKEKYKETIESIIEANIFLLKQKRIECNEFNRWLMGLLRGLVIAGVITEFERDEIYEEYER